MVLPSAYIVQNKIFVAGQENTALSNDLIAATIEETDAGLYRCELTLNNFGANGSNFDYLYFERDVLDFGTEIALEIGSTQSQTRIFKGRITGLEADYPEGGGSRLTVLAEDALQDLRMTRRTRNFEDMSDEDIVRDVVQTHGLTPDLQMSGPTHHNVAQVNLSDLAFIRQCARRVDVELWVEGQTIYARNRRDRAADGSITLAYGADLVSFSVRADLAHQCTELQLAGWNVASKSSINETANEQTISEELNSGEVSGSAVLDQAFGRRVASIVHRVPLTNEEGRSIAEAEYRCKARRFVTGRAMSDGNPEIFVGRAVELTRLGTLFDGVYYVTHVVHSFDRVQGFHTEFEVERPGLGS